MFGAAGLIILLSWSFTPPDEIANVPKVSQIVGVRANASFCDEVVPDTGPRSQNLQIVTKRALPDGRSPAKRTRLGSSNGSWAEQ
jgi:hypothetical protein